MMNEMIKKKNDDEKKRNFSDFHRCSCSGHVISIEKGSEETDQIEGKLGKLFT